METQKEKLGKQVTLPDWVDSLAFPFISRKVNIDGSEIHFIDEGEGPILLFSHPACAWSFMYRDLIKKLSKHFRCIAFDYPGFGFSAAGQAYEYTIENQSQILTSFIQKLELSNILFLGHDTGGPAGFYLATQNPDLFDGFLITDTIIYPTNEYKSLHRFLGVLNTWPVKLINQQFNPIVWGMLNRLKAKKVPKPIQEHYFKTFNTFKSRERIRQLLVSLRNSEALMLAVKEAFHSTLIDKPALLIYGKEDPVNELGIPERILSTLKNAELHIIEKEGHFPHEGNGGEMAQLILEWYSNSFSKTR